MESSSLVLDINQTFSIFRPQILFKNTTFEETFRIYAR